MEGSLFDKAFGRLCSILNALATVWIFILMLIIVTDVVGRSLFNHPLTGAPELVKVSLVALVFLQITHTLREDRHVRSTLLVGFVPPFLRVLLRIFADLLGLVFFVLLCYSSWPQVVSAWRVLEYEGEGALNVPTYPVRAIILFCSALMVIQFFMNLVKGMKGLSTRSKDRSD
ncbi:MAG: TRAP transporter small permease [Pseudomonadota bacterium]